TVQATNKTEVSAKLNGIFVNQTGTSAQGYFQYGKTVSLGKTTIIKNLGSVSSINFSQIITGLEPDTIYFFRAVSINQSTTYNGNILVFKTLKEIIIPEVNPVEENRDVEIASIESPIVEDQIDYTNIATTEFTITNGAENLVIGDEINYIINFKNIASLDLENVKITVQLPNEVDFKESNLGKLTSDNTVIFETKNLVSDQTGSMTIKTVINPNASLKNILVTTAMMSYGVAGTNINKDDIAYITNYITPETTGLEANPLFGLNSLPYLLGWFILLLIVLGIIFIVIKKIYTKNSLKKNTKIITDHINNLEK
ncbi:MAG: hypothetical protein WA101_00240, partial [Minisyncoccia bacterium]